MKLFPKLNVRSSVNLVCFALEYLYFILKVLYIITPYLSSLSVDAIACFLQSPKAEKENFSHNGSYV